MSRISIVSLALLGVFIAMNASKPPLPALSTGMWIFSSIATASFCYASAVELLGLRAASIFAGIALAVGWGMEQIGTLYGFPFGRYVYTDVLGPRIGEVPFVIPLMWFSFTYIAYTMSNLTVWQRPSHKGRQLFDVCCSSVLVGFIVTVYDLVADPYMFKVAKAWTMIGGGSYFGETAQGFFGWFITGTLISGLFRWAVPTIPDPEPGRIHRYSAAWPLFAFAFYIGFFIDNGEPPETRSIALFAMGLPLIFAFAGWRRWIHSKDAPVALSLSTGSK